MIISKNIIYIILLFIILIFGFLNYSSFISKNNLKDNELSKQIKTDIENGGPTYAWENFKKENLPGGLSHQNGHIFGETLYKVVGPSGAGYCDSSFEYACYHGFFIAGIEDRGESIVEEFNNGCIEILGREYLPCQHGIGHGLLAMGITIDEALGACKKISKISTGGCSSGVFMEYNFPTLSDHSGTRIRELEGNNYYSPCVQIDPYFKNSCYFELPQWWNSLGKKYLEFGELCEKVSDADNRKWCYLGSGNYIATFVNFSVDKTISACNLFSKNGNDWCREGASWILLSRPNGKDLAKKICWGYTECQENLFQNPSYSKKN